jgi:hypothetical protein
MTWITRYRPWLLWSVSTVGLATLLAANLNGGDRRIFVPDATTDGHYQIEIACTACHTTSFASKDDMQAACEGCHAEALDAARDSHPRSKFTDPRNVDRTALLDARYCVTRSTSPPRRTRWD